MEQDRIDSMMNLADITSENPQLKPILDIVNPILGLSDDTLTPAAVESIEGMIKGSMTPALKQQAVDAIIEQYRNESATRGRVKNEVKNFKASIEELITDLEPSKVKEQLLRSAFSIFFEIFDEAAERYNSFDIVLPMTLEEGAKAPAYAHETDAAADFYALEDMTLPAHSLSNKVRTGVRIALPENWVFLLDPRSSIGAKTGLRLSNSLGVIDEDYRGEIMILYDNISDSDYEIKAGDRIAQGWVQPVYRFKPVVVESLPATERGEGGFGSTGK
jgi:dUTP pyrophosphatase